MLALLACGHAVASPDDFRCFKSIDHKPPIRLEFDFAGDNDGYVTYEHGHGKIHVVNVETKEVRDAGDRPGEFRMHWKEQVDGSAGGEYILRSQGARVSDFRYIRNKDGKVFRFEEDVQASGENACTWNK